MSVIRVDVSDLPPLGFGSRGPLWWGVVGMLAIESTMFGILVAAYLYLRQRTETWPPPGTPWPTLLPGVLNVLLLLASVAPMVLAHRGALAERRRPVAIGLGLGAVAALLALAVRAWEFNAFQTRWDAHAYGSLVWFTLGMHTAHLLASGLENLLLAVLMVRGPVERKHHVDAEMNAVYWYFVVLVWLPLAALLYLGPRLL